MGSGKGQTKRVASISILPRNVSMDDRHAFFKDSINHADAKKATKVFKLPRKLLSNMDDKTIMINSKELVSFLNNNDKYSLMNWNKFMSGYFRETRIRFELDNKGTKKIKVVIDKNVPDNHLALHRLSAMNLSVISEKEGFSLDMTESIIRSGALQSDKIIFEKGEFHGTRITANKLLVRECESNGAKFTTISDQPSNKYDFRSSKIDNAHFEKMNLNELGLYENKMRGKTELIDNNIKILETESNELSRIVATNNKVDSLVEDLPDRQLNGRITAINNSLSRTNSSSALFKKVFTNMSPRSEPAASPMQHKLKKEKPIKADINF